MNAAFYLNAAPSADSYALFRGTFECSAETQLELKHLGASWYRIYLDGSYLAEGPARFSPQRPEYLVQELRVSAGKHILAIQLHYEGVETRILKNYDPFLWIQLSQGQELLEIDWKGLALQSCKPKLRRINPQLAWAEVRDTRLDPIDWQQLDCDGSHWSPTAAAASDLPEPSPAKLASPLRLAIAPRLLAEGPLATRFGYADDDPPYTFFSRDRSCSELPATGSWRRYDLGRIRLGSPQITLTLPAGTVIEVGYSEFLTDSRVSPWINFSLGQSCNWDRFVARGGRQTFEPLTPKGGRFIEIHALAPSDSVEWNEVSYTERTYFKESEAKLSLGDELLERIWHVGIETLRGCAEDALIDNPTRERGQWVGDVVSVGLGINSVAYHDLRLCRRGLQHSAECPREDGLIAGMSPGGCVYLPTYALQWTTASIEYYRHSRDLDYLKEFWDAAKRNLTAIAAFETPEGLGDVAGWNFVDWGYLPTPGGVDLACNLHYLEALRSMAVWSALLGEASSPFERKAIEYTQLLKTWITKLEDSGGVEAIGYHCLTLALRLGVFDGDKQAAVQLLKQHWAKSFPSNLQARRLDDPFNSNQRLSTPYFAHYLFPALIEAGEWQFVIDQIKRCWGWMLQDDRTTWMEVFDTRWSHCHQWAGCPTWILSRYVLGLFPRFDRESGSFDLHLETFGLPKASGRLPLPQGGWAEISWEKSSHGIHYTLCPTHPISVRLANSDTISCEAGKSQALELPL